MEYSVKTGPLSSQRANCIIVGVFNEQRLSGQAQSANQLLDGQIKRCLQNGDLSPKAGNTILLPQAKGAAFARVLLVSCGNKDDFNEQSFVQVSKAAYSVLKTLNSKDVLNCLTDLPVNDLDWRVRKSQWLVEASFYQFTEFKSSKAEKYSVKKMLFLAKDAKQSKTLRDLLAQGQAVGKGMALTKDLGNTPSNVCTPTYLAKQARDLAKQYASVKTKIVEEAEMKKLGMNALLSVSKGSEQAPKLIIMEYNGSKKKGAKPVALVGKGVTFDTGGISIKPSLNMEEMKFDMCGAASVFGTIKSIAELKLPINVVAIVGAVENMPSHNASKPGDIVTTMSGQTVEIINTDAEGRLVLCDALTYVKRYKPETIIDIATLTGAIVIALGKQAAGVFTHDDKLAKEIADASDTTADRSWRFPMWPEYFDSLKSPYADMTNCGDRGAGSITAAIYLSRFTKDQRWAHIDIAGVAYNLNGKSEGASGRPVPLLVEFLRKRCQG